jgi:hypothetical protein
MVNHADLRNGERGKGKMRGGTIEEGMKERVGIRKPENQSEFVFRKSEGKK